MGNTALSLTYDINPESPYVRQNTVNVEVAPIIVDIDKDGINELIVVSSEKTPISSVIGKGGIKSNWLTFYKYKDKRFIKGLLGKSLEQYIKGFGIYDGKVLVVVSEIKGLLKDVNKNTDIIIF